MWHGWLPCVIFIFIFPKNSNDELFDFSCLSKKKKSVVIGGKRREGLQNNFKILIILPLEYMLLGLIFPKYIYFN